MAIPVLILLKKFHFFSKFLRSSLNVCESVISMSMFWICLFSGKCIDIVMPRHYNIDTFTTEQTYPKH